MCQLLLLEDILAKGNSSFSGASLLSRRGPHSILFIESPRKGVGKMGMD